VKHAQDQLALFMHFPVHLEFKTIHP
jgi:hypothetical protein